MNDPNPYASPNESGEPSRETRPPWLSIKAVVLGWLADMVATFMASLALALVAFFAIMSRDTPPVEAAGIFHRSMLMQLASVAIRFLATMFGAYTAERIAERSEMRHAVAVGILTLGGFTALFFWRGTQPTWFLALGMAVIIPAALAGGWLAKSFAPRPPSDWMDKLP